MRTLMNNPELIRAKREFGRKEIERILAKAKADREALAKMAKAAKTLFTPPPILRFAS